MTLKKGHQKGSPLALWAALGPWYDAQTKTQAYALLMGLALYEDQAEETAVCPFRLFLVVFLVRSVLLVRLVHFVLKRNVHIQCSLLFVAGTGQTKNSTPSIRLCRFV